MRRASGGIWIATSEMQTGNDLKRCCGWYFTVERHFDTMNYHRDVLCNRITHKAFMLIDRCEISTLKFDRKMQVETFMVIE